MLYYKLKYVSAVLGPQNNSGSNMLNISLFPKKEHHMKLVCSVNELKSELRTKNTSFITFVVVFPLIFVKQDDAVFSFGLASKNPSSLTTPSFKDSKQRYLR